jgi:hypothetical protein
MISAASAKSDTLEVACEPRPAGLGRTPSRNAAGWRPPIAGLASICYYNLKDHSISP